MSFRKNGENNAEMPDYIDLVDDDDDDDEEPLERITLQDDPWQNPIQDTNQTFDFVRPVPSEESNNPNKEAQDDKSACVTKKPKLSHNIHSNIRSTSNDRSCPSRLSYGSIKATYYKVMLEYGASMSGEEMELFTPEANARPNSSSSSAFMQTEPTAVTNSGYYGSENQRARLTSTNPYTTMNCRAPSGNEPFIPSSAVTAPSIFEASTPVSQTQQVTATNSESESENLRLPTPTSTSATFNYRFPATPEASSSSFTNAIANEEIANATSANRIPNNANNPPVSSVSDDQVGYDPWWKRIPPAIENEAYLRQITASYFQNQGTRTNEGLTCPQQSQNPHPQELGNSDILHASHQLLRKTRVTLSADVTITVNDINVDNFLLENVFSLIGVIESIEYVDEVTTIINYSKVYKYE